MSTAWEIARQNISEAQVSQTFHYNKTAHDVDLKLNDKAYKLNRVCPQGLTKKLTRPAMRRTISYHGFKLSCSYCRSLFYRETRNGTCYSHKTRS